MKYFLTASIVLVLSVVGYFTVKGAHQETVNDRATASQSMPAQTDGLAVEMEQEESHQPSINHTRSNGEDLHEQDKDEIANEAHYAQHMVADYFNASEVERFHIASEISRITTFSQQAQNIELQILDGLFNDPSSQDEWAQLLSDIGVRSTEGHNMILAILPTITDNTALSKVLSSLLPVHVDADHKIVVSENIKPYLANDDEFVRASATLTQSLWVDNVERTKVIQTGFVDSSIEVRFSAATAATLSNEQTPEVKEVLLRTVADPTEDPLVREQAENALMNYE